MQYNWQKAIWLWVNLNVRALLQFTLEYLYYACAISAQLYLGIIYSYEMVVKALHNLHKLLLKDVKR